MPQPPETQTPVPPGPDLNLIPDQSQNPNPNPAPVTPTDTPAIPHWQSAVFHANQEANRLRQELDALRSQQNQPQPPAAPNFEPGDILNKPNEFVSYIQQTMAEQVAPLRQFAEAQQRTNLYTGLKNRMLSMSDPISAQQFRMIEGYVDNIMANQHPTEQNLMTAIQQVTGWLVMNNPQLFAAIQNVGRPTAPNNPPNTLPTQPNNPPPNNPNPVLPPNIPAHLRGTPNTPAPTKRATWDDLNEHERRLAREQRMGPNQFIAYRDCPPEQLMARAEELSKITD